MLNNLVKLISSPEYKANEELKAITSSLDSIIDVISTNTGYNHCLAALDQLGERINEFGRKHLIHCENQSDAELLPCKQLVAKALNEFSTQDFASALARADACGRNEALSLWIDDLSTKQPFLARDIDRLIMAAKNLLGD